MPDVYFENVHTKNRYKVESFDRDAGTVTLIGRHGVPFTEKYSKERFEEMGYRPVQDGAPAAPAAPPAPPAPPVGAAPPPPVSQTATA